MGRAPSLFRQRDMARAIKAAKSGGLDVTRVEVDVKTGHFVLVVKNEDATETKVNPFADLPVPVTKPRRKTKTCTSNSN